MEKNISNNLHRTFIYRTQRGMTLIEIMIVLSIIGLVMGLGGRYAYNTYKKSLVKTARLSIMGLKQQAELYFQDYKNCPTLEDLAKDSRDGKDRKEIKDPWGSPYQIICPSTHGTAGDVDITSNGPDKQEGTEDDVLSWDENSGPKP